MAAGLGFKSKSPKPPSFSHCLSVEEKLLDFISEMPRSSPATRELLEELRPRSARKETESELGEPPGNLPMSTHTVQPAALTASDAGLAVLYRDIPDAAQADGDLRRKRLSGFTEVWPSSLAKAGVSQGWQSR
jgi:hypothetical protein